MTPLSTPANITAWVARLALVVIAIWAGTIASRELAYSGGPPRYGQQAIPNWRTGPEAVTPLPDAVHLPCTFEQSADVIDLILYREQRNLPGPIIGFSIDMLIAKHGDKTTGGETRPYATSSNYPGWDYCVFPTDDGYLWASFEGHYFRTGKDLFRTDKHTTLERLGLCFEREPLSGIAALALLGVGTWLVLRRWRPSWMTAAGVALAWCWLIPLRTFFHLM